MFSMFAVKVTLANLIKLYCYFLFIDSEWLYSHGYRITM